MKTIQFQYTKADNSQSVRTLVVHNEPGKFITGTDISELSLSDRDAYIQEIAEAKRIYLEMLAQINSEFDVNYNYRQFDPSRMSNVLEI